MMDPGQNGQSAKNYLLAKSNKFKDILTVFVKIDRKLIITDKRTYRYFCFSKSNISLTSIRFQPILQGNTTLFSHL